MNILKQVIIGALVGSAIFFAPFLIIKVVLFSFLIIGLLKLFSPKRFGRGGGSHKLAFADKIRNMTPEEYETFKQNKNDCYDGCNKNTNNENKNK